MPMWCRNFFRGCFAIFYMYGRQNLGVHANHPFGYAPGCNGAAKEGNQSCRSGDHIVGPQNIRLDIGFKSKINYFRVYISTLIWNHLCFLDVHHDFCTLRFYLIPSPYKIYINFSVKSSSIMKYKYTYFKYRIYF